MRKTFYYPDVFVACDKANRYFRQEPILIIEVLSPSTERIDKNEKLNVYRQISKMLEYLIVSQNKVRIELCRKQLNGNWTKEVFTKAEVVLQLESVDLSFNLAEIYRGITFDE